MGLTVDLAYTCQRIIGVQKGQAGLPEILLATDEVATALLQHMKKKNRLKVVYIKTNAQTNTSHKNR